MLTGDPAALPAIASGNPFHALAGAGPDMAPSVAESGLEAYWECMERQDIREVLDLLEAHRTVRRIDARLYGLPRDDFDDAQNLTVAERLFLRSWAKEQGMEWPTEGFIQYPREIRHTLREIYRNTGMLPDCSGRLNDALGCDTASLLVREVEKKLYNDSGGDNEVNIVVNPYAQQYLLATSNAYSSSANETYYSSDWGKTWSHGATLGSSSCDPVSFYNSQQTLYHSYLQSNGAIKVNYSSNHGQTWTACSATVESASMDRQDLYIDTFSGDGGLWTASPCLNKLYVGYHNGGAQVMKSSTGDSAPHCGSWSTRVSLASPGNSGTIGTAITSAIGKNGGSGNGTLLYLFSRYASPNQGIYVSTSTNCGSSLGTPSKIAALNNGGNFEWGIPSACSRMTYIYPSADADRQPLSAFRNNVYETWNDLSSACTAPGCNNNTTCNSDVYVARGVPDNRDNPTGWTWTTVNLTKNVVGTDSYTDEFYPALSVDQADGSIYLTYYRSASGANNNLAARRQQVHYVALRSIDGGATWQSVLQVTAQPTNEYDSGADQAMQWGDYTWNDVINGVLYPCWTDRREAADEDVWASKVCSEPSHWVERGASPTVPATTATPGANKVVTVSWALPDLYWGDGGEAAASRKFQLFVDGSLNQDNIGATTTSTTYTAADCTTAHTFRVRAVNSCGVTKDYTTATATATGCAGAAPPPVNETGAGAARFTKGAGNTLNVSYDAATCSAQKLIILTNAIGTWTGYAACAQPNGGNAGSTTIDSTGQTAAWYNLVWTNGTTAGHPGFATGGTRTWSVGTLCGMTTDDKNRTTCP